MIRVCVALSNLAICASISMIESVKMITLREKGQFDGEIVACAISREHVSFQNEIFYETTDDEW